MIQKYPDTLVIDKAHISTFTLNLGMLNLEHLQTIEVMPRSYKLTGFRSFRSSTKQSTSRIKKTIHWKIAS